MNFQTRSNSFSAVTFDINIRCDIVLPFYRRGAFNDNFTEIISIRTSRAYCYESSIT